MALVDDRVLFDATVICGAFVRPYSVNYTLLELANDGLIDGITTDVAAYEFVHNAYKGKLTGGEPVDPDLLTEFLDGFPHLFDPATTPRVSIGRNVVDRVWLLRKPVGQVVYELTGRRRADLLMQLREQQVVDIEDFDPSDLHLLVAAVEQEADIVCSSNTTDLKQPAYGSIRVVTPVGAGYSVSPGKQTIQAGLRSWQPHPRPLRPPSLADDSVDGHWCARAAFPQLFHKGCGTSAGRICARSASRARERSAGEQLDQFSPLTVAEAGDRLRVGDPAAGEHAIGAKRTDPGHDQKQLAHLRRLHAARRLGDQLRRLDSAGRDSALQLRPGDTNLVRLRQRAQSLLGRPSKRCRGAAHNRHGADSTSSRDSSRGEKKRPEAVFQHPGSVHATARQYLFPVHAFS